MKSYLILLGLFQYVYGGDISIGYAPPTLRFGHASPLSLFDLDDVIAASLGYSTTSTALWKGLTVTSPFNLPKAAVLVEIKSGKAVVDREGPSYLTKSNVPLETVMNILSSKLKSQAQRSLNFQDIEVSDVLSKGSPPISVHVLNSNDKVDDQFLSEMKNLPNIISDIEKESVLAHGGQDIVFVTVNSFYPLVEKYGANSSEVKEATNILRISLSQLIDNLRQRYNDNVLFMSVLTNTNEVHKRTKRNTFTDKVEDTMDVNLTEAYNEDFPVVFNIILFFSIVMVIAIIAVSASMAFMDPGRDSIIYRMTNPRMKKD